MKCKDFLEWDLFGVVFAIILQELFHKKVGMERSNLRKVIFGQKCFVLYLSRSPIFFCALSTDIFVAASYENYDC